MATNTQINQAVLSPEQQALAKAELEQMQRRMGFEDFMSQILLGGVPGKATAGAASTSVPAAPLPVPQTPGVPSTGGGSAVQQTVNNSVSNAANLGSLLIPRSAGGVPGSTFGNSLSGVGGKLLDLATDPKTLGTAAGLATGVPGGAAIGRLLGGGLGDLLSGSEGEAPSPETVKSSVSVAPPMQVTSVIAPNDRSPGGPTGAQTAARAQQTALDGLHTQANNSSMQYTAADATLDPAEAGKASGNAYGNTMSNIAVTAANKIIAEFKAAGKDITDPAVGREISARVHAALASAGVPQRSGSNQRVS